MLVLLLVELETLFVDEDDEDAVLDDEDDETLLAVLDDDVDELTDFDVDEVLWLEAVERLWLLAVESDEREPLLLVRLLRLDRLLTLRDDVEVEADLLVLVDAELVD